MAKHITLLNKDPKTLNVNAPKNDFLQSLAGKGKTVKIADIVTKEPFVSLFPIKEEVLQSIAENMRLNGYDYNQPVIIWKEANVLVDGHTRLQAAKIAGLDSVQVFYASFQTEDEVLDYMHHIQFNRRNITDGDLISLIINALPKYEKKYGEGSKAEFLIKRFAGLSETKAKRVILIIESANKNDINLITQEQSTINQVYNKLKQDKNTLKQKVHVDFFEDDGGRRCIRCNDDGVFYFRDYEKMKEMKAFVLPVFINSTRIREKIRQVIEEEFGGVE